MFALIGTMLTAVVQFIKGGMGVLGAGIISTLVVLFGAWPVAIYGVLVIVMGILGYNLMCDFLRDALQWVSTQMSSVSSPGGMPTAGLVVGNLAGWFATKLKIIQCLSFIFNAIVAKWLIVKVPFLKW